MLSSCLRSSVILSMSSATSANGSIAEAALCACRPTSAVLHGNRTCTFASCACVRPRAWIGIMLVTGCKILQLGSHCI